MQRSTWRRLPGGARRLRAGAASSVVAFALLASGCATSGDMQKLQARIADLQEQVAQLKQTSAGKEEVQNVNAKIADQTEQLLKSNATLVAKVDQMDEKINNAQGSIEQTNYRVDRVVEQMTQAQHDLDDLKAAAARAAAATAAPGIQPPLTEVSVAPPAAPGEDPMQMYQAAYRDYQRGNFDLSIAGFKEFVARNPKSDLADNAAYWIGESLFSQKKYREAIEQFDSVVTSYPKSDKVPGALLKKGYAYINLGEKAQGVVQLQYVVHEHPNTQEATLARQRLKQLGIETR